LDAFCNMASVNEALIELEALLPQVKQPRNVELIRSEIAKMKKEAAAQTAAAASAATDSTGDGLPGEDNSASAADGSTSDKSKASGKNDSTPAPSAKATSSPGRPPAVIPGVKYISPPSFGWDQKGDWVNVMVMGLNGVGALDKSEVSCDFTKDSFDLRVHNLNGKNYRVLRDNLDKDIIPEKSKIRIKSNKIYVKLHKVPGEYGPDHWTELTSKKSKKDKRERAKAKKDDPMGGIMDLMKDMYDNGDEKMKETIGKAMYDSRMGKKTEMPDAPDLGSLGGMGM